LPASGTQSVTVAQTTVYSIACSGAGGTGKGSVSVTAYSEPVPAISVDQNAILAGASVVVSWSSQQSTACTVGGGGLSSAALAGTQTVGPLSASTTFAISCTNPLFTTAVVASATTTVSPTVSLTVNAQAQVPGAPIVDAAGRHYVPDWAHPVTVAVPYVYVEIDDANQHMVQNAYADANGDAQFAGLDATATYTVVLQSKVKTTAAPILDFEVVNNTAPLSTSQTSFRGRYGTYSASTAYVPSANNAASQTVTLTATDGWDLTTSTLVDANRVAAPFFLLASAVLEAQIVSPATGLANPTWRPLTILWSVANKGGLAAPPDNYDQGTAVGSGGFWSNGHKAISSSGTDTGNGNVAEDFIFLSGDPSFEIMDLYPTVMTHEMGHFVQSLFSTDNSPGGNHSYTDYQDPTLSWIEGNASGISALVMNTPQQRRVMENGGEIMVQIDDISNDTIDGTPVANTSAPWPIGWYQESTVTGFMWSAYSAMGLTTAQTLAPMFSAAWKAGPYLDTIWSYATLLKQENPTVAAGIDSFGASHGFVAAANDAYGSKETNAGNRTAQDVLPPSTTVAVGQTVSLCSVGKPLEFNKSGNARIFEVIGDGASHTLTIQGPANTVPILNRNLSGVHSGSAILTQTGSVPTTGKSFTVGECGVVAGDFASDTTACGDPSPPAEQCWSISYQ
jgi:hypothetical protein